MIRSTFVLLSSIILSMSSVAGLFAQNPLEQLEAKIQRDKGKPVPVIEEPAVSPVIPQTPSDTKSSVPTEEKLPGPLRMNFGQESMPRSPTTPSSRTDSTTAPSLDVPGLNPELAPREPGYLGMTVERAPVGLPGLRVVDVVNQSPAWKGGFRTGDRVLAVSGQSVSSIDEFAGEIARYSGNDPVRFLVDRRGRSVELVAVLLPRSIASQTQPLGAIPALPSNSLPSNPLPSSSSSTVVSPYVDRRVPQAIDNRGQLGIIVSTLSNEFRQRFGIPVYRGASVLEVIQGSPAYLAGMSPGDCIVDVDGIPIQSEADLVQWSRQATVGVVVGVNFYRGPQLMQTSLQIPGNNGNPSDRMSNRSNSNSLDGSTVTPDMLTPEYVIQLQVELTSAKQQLQQLQKRLEALETRVP